MSGLIWIPGLIIFVGLIPVAIIYAIRSVNKKKKRAVAACVRDIQYLMNEVQQKEGRIATRHDVRSVATSYDNDVYQKALEQLGIVLNDEIIPPAE